MSITIIQPKGLGLYRVVGNNNHNVKERLCGGFIVSKHRIVRYIAKLGTDYGVASNTPSPFLKQLELNSAFRGGTLSSDGNYRHFYFGAFNSGGGDASTFGELFGNDVGGIFRFNAFNNIADNDYHVFEIVNKNNVFISGLPTINSSTYINSIIKIPYNFTLSDGPYETEAFQMPRVEAIEYSDDPIAQAHYEVDYDDNGEFEQRNETVIEINGRKRVHLSIYGLQRIEIDYDIKNKVFLAPTYFYYTLTLGRIFLWFDETEWVYWDDDSNSIITP